MLRRRFKTEKCKTSLRLALSRMKTLRNKRENHLKQMKRDVAQLLDARQHQRAKIQVEHLIREEKMMAAYDILEVYCEFILARLPVIEVQKNCPVDLKEAVASVIFASQRCIDIQELHDVHKHFARKYGREFISSILELRHNCGVSHMFLDKLSAKAPDGEEKMKMLTGIAQEHSIKWDNQAFSKEALKPANNVPDTCGHNPVAFVESDKDALRGSSYSFGSYSEGENTSTVPAVENSYLTPHVSGSVRVTKCSMHPSGRDDNDSFSGHKWIMGFKDATEAARVAAESAEKASWAARVAAELSSGGKGTGHNSLESHISYSYESTRTTGPQFSENAESMARINDDSDDSFISRPWSRPSEEMTSDLVGRVQSRSAGLGSINKSSRHALSQGNTIDDDVEISPISCSQYSTSFHPATDPSVDVVRDGDDLKHDINSFGQDLPDVGNKPPQGGSESLQTSNQFTVVYDVSGSESDDLLEPEGSSTRPKFDMHFEVPGRKSLDHLPSESVPWNLRQRNIVPLLRNVFMEEPFVTKMPSADCSEGFQKASVLSQSSDLLPASFDESDSGDSMREDIEHLNVKQHVPTPDIVMVPQPFDVSPHFTRGVSTLVKARSKDTNFIKDNEMDMFWKNHPNSSKQEVSKKFSFSSEESCGASRVVANTSSHVSSDDSEPDEKNGSNLPSLGVNFSQAGERELPSSGDSKELDVSNCSMNGSEPRLNLGQLRGGLRNKRFMGLLDINCQSEQETTTEAVSTSENQSLHVPDKCFARYKTFERDRSSLAPYNGVEEGLHNYDEVQPYERAGSRGSQVGSPSHRTMRMSLSEAENVPTRLSRLSKGPSTYVLEEDDSQDSKLSSSLQQHARPLSQTEKSTQVAEDSFRLMSNTVKPNGRVTSRGFSRASAARIKSFQSTHHVHPKLPDYDVLAAQLESLRSDRQ